MDSFYPIEVKPLENHRLLVTFNNKEKRIFDVTPYLNDIFFAPLRDKAIFQSAKINPLTVEWTGGIDFCPDELYYNSRPVEKIEEIQKLVGRVSAQNIFPN